MKIKAADVNYCGVSEENIKTAQPILNEGVLEQMKTFILKRCELRIKKDVIKQLAPWTDWEPLLKYRFTNIFREDDKQTRWLINNIIHNPKLSYQDKLANCVLFRMWNKYETVEILNGPWRLDQLRDPEFKENKRNLVNSHSCKNLNYVWFTNVFNTGGVKRSNRREDGGLYVGKDFQEGDEICVPLRPFHLPIRTLDFKFFNKLENASNQLEVYNLLRTIKGFGTFLSYQIFVDWTYIPEFPFSENEFTVAGPGCCRGIDRLFQEKAGMSYEECLFWIRDNQDSIFRIDFETLFYDRDSGERKLNVMCIENIFCELSKLMRFITGEGQPKLKYRQPEETLF